MVRRILRVWRLEQLKMDFHPRCTAGAAVVISVLRVTCKPELLEDYPWCDLVAFSYSFSAPTEDYDYLLCRAPVSGLMVNEEI